ncbi:MAG: aminotransferase class III-fold pyridoxal phosphate-dependent enzyme, partial [Eubacteriales bacterium]|nr:aminotransferase class III-fold pyridoxal phosphate-dependent enzyme [Eubacteriales bacterium]
EYLDKHKVIEGVEKKGNLLKRALSRIAGKSDIVGDVRGLGLMLGVEFVRNKAGGVPFEPGMNIASRAVDIAIGKGLVVYPVRGCADGVKGDGLLICPPLTISNDEIGFMARVLDETIMELQAEIAPVLRSAKDG